MEVRDDIALYGKLATLRKPPWIAGQVEVTTKCFQQCPWCESWKEANGAHHEWTLEQMLNLCHDLASAKQITMFEHLTLTGGDPQAWQPLSELLAKHLAYDKPFEMQCSTALARDVKNPDLWSQGFSEVRLSLDAADPDVYREVRGVSTDPRLPLQRLLALKTKRSIITTVGSANIDDLENVLRLVEHEGGDKIRRHMVLPVLGTDHPPQFWVEWYRLVNHWAKPGGRVVFSTVPGHDSNIRCWVRRISFHLKANGSLFPCCLLGGEAIETHPEEALGNVWEQPIDSLHQGIPPYCYKQADLPCDQVCHAKQYAMNVAGQTALETTLSMP